MCVGVAGYIQKVCVKYGVITYSVSGKENAMLKVK